MTAGRTLSAVAGNAASFFTHAGGIQVIAANGPVSLQAHTDGLEILADRDVTVVSVNDGIEIKAKDKIVLQAGQSAVTLEGGDITFACPGTFSVKGGKHVFDKGRSLPAELLRLPDSRQRIYKERLRAVDAISGAPIPNLSYKILFHDGTHIIGNTDSEGKTEQVSTPEKELLKVFWGVNKEEMHDDTNPDERC